MACYTWTVFVLVVSLFVGSRSRCPHRHSARPPILCPSGVCQRQTGNDACRVTAALSRFARLSWMPGGHRAGNRRRGDDGADISALADTVRSNALDGARGVALSLCACLCTRKRPRKAGPFAVPRLKLDLPFHNRLAHIRAHRRSASPPGGARCCFRRSCHLNCDMLHAAWLCWCCVIRSGWR